MSTSDHVLCLLATDGALCRAVGRIHVGRDNAQPSIEQHRVTCAVPCDPALSHCLSDTARGVAHGPAGEHFGTWAGVYLELSSPIRPHHRVLADTITLCKTFLSPLEAVSSSQPVLFSLIQPDPQQLICQPPSSASHTCGDSLESFLTAFSLSRGYASRTF